MLDEEAIELKYGLSTLMFAQTRLLDFVLHQLLEAKDLNEDEKYIEETIRMMLQSIGVSIHSILKLTEKIDMGIKDCFGIARTVFEMSVNVAYIAASNVDVAKRAQMHALQKTYRDLHRIDENSEFKIELQANQIPDPHSIDGLVEALDTFTRKNGQEIRSWSPKSIDQKIKVVSDFNKKASLSLNVSKFSIYRHSSELLHGSYFGVKYFWSSSSGTLLNREELENHWVQSHFVGVFSAVFFGTAGVIETCIQKFSLNEVKEPLDDLFEKANEIIFSLEGVN